MFARNEADPAVPQFTLRAILTGMTLGALLVPCNVYSGLKIGWSFNMSITAALLSLGFWQLWQRWAGTSAWGKLENNINQTAASSAASIVSAGLVAPIPALTLLTGQQLSWPVMSIWIFSVSLIGVLVALALRNQMLVVEKLTFPAGVATAEVMQDIYAHGKEAVARIKILAASALVSGGVKAIDNFIVNIPKLGLPSSLYMPAIGKLKTSGYTKISLTNLGFVWDPSLLMIGFGAIVGIRVGLSMLLGAVLAWGVLGPWSLGRGWAHPGENLPGAFWYDSLIEWLLWPGVTLMVVASLTSFGFTLVNAFRARKRSRSNTRSSSTRSSRIGWGFKVGFLGSVALAVITQVSIFNITPWVAVVAVFFTFVMAVVAARVSGETGIAPIGALGKVTQLTFGVISPANVTTNLMSANVTGGAAGQCSDLLHDLKTGLLLGASARLQSLAQLFGILAGSLAGSAAYLILIPDPQQMLLTQEWPAPAVVVWKTVAEVLQAGLDSLPPASGFAMAIAGTIGVLMGALEKILPARWLRLMPSPASVGMAFIIPAWISISMFLGGLLSWVLKSRVPQWHQRFLVVLAAGLVTGESLVGVAHALIQMLFD